MSLTPRRDLLAFGSVLGLLLAIFFHESLFEGKILSSADVLFASKSYELGHGSNYEPRNRLLMDPVLQFQPWIQFNREQLRAGRLPLWNPYAGCGAPHLANGQSAVFDPFLMIAYLTSEPDLPHAFGWIAAARLWFAGLGMFLLVRGWGAGPWGRWFSGLTFPFCGFLVVWLEYPVTSSAVWLPWILLATDRVLEFRTRWGFALLALTTAGCILGGHVQTSAHVLLLVGLYALWRGVTRSKASLLCWSGALIVGFLIASIEIIPLAYYLTKSPVWNDRAAERTSPWAIEKPRVLDSVCVAIPYAYGSQRRGHPNLARALGVHNLNESAGGFCGLATLLWLAPLAWMVRKEKPVVLFLFVTGGLALAASLRLPPIDNLLRMIPVLNVTDNRRISLWTAFALTALGGFGLDALATMQIGRLWRGWSSVWVFVALICLIPAVSVGRFESRLRHDAREHYARAAAETPGADLAAFLARADRQTNDVLRFIPRYYSTVAVHLLGLAGMLGAIQAGLLRRKLAQPLILAVVLADLIGFGYGLNPAIAREEQDELPPIVAALQLDPPGRILALGAELPPNTLMRFGLRDVRNYDSIELSQSFAWFESLYEPDARGSHTSRREILWSGVMRSLGRLSGAGVSAIVAPSPPPPGAFGRVQRVGSTWLVRLACRPLTPISPDLAAPGYYLWNDVSAWNSRHPDEFEILEIAESGWRAWVDGVEVKWVNGTGPFLRIPLGHQARRVELKYDPIEVKIASLLSIFGGSLLVFGLTLTPLIRSTRNMRLRLGRNRATGLRL